MMSDELYQKAIIEQARAAKAAGRLEDPQASVVLDNPLCGDRITLDLSLEGDRVAGIGHRVRGCLLCQAAASAIGANAIGRTSAQLRETAANVTAMLRGHPLSADGWPELAAFEPVRGFKSRHECVLLPFEALTEALDRAESEGGP